jgi:hypothetical protein
MKHLESMLVVAAVVAGGQACISDRMAVLDGMGGSGATAGSGTGGSAASNAGGSAASNAGGSAASGTGGSQGGAAGSGGGTGNVGNTGGSAGSGGSPPQPECTPNDVQDVGACARCGTQRKRCNANGFWDAAVCESQGECEVGDGDQSDCEDCGQRVCSNSCNWGDCEPDPGNDCLWDTGHTWRYCGGDNHHWQWCLSSCVWAPCAYCTCDYCVPSC